MLSLRPQGTVSLETTSFQPACHKHPHIALYSLKYSSLALCYAVGNTATAVPRPIRTQ